MGVPTLHTDLLESSGIVCVGMTICSFAVLLIIPCKSPLGCSASVMLSPGQTDCIQYYPSQFLVIYTTAGWLSKIYLIQAAGRYIGFPLLSP